MTTRDLRFRAWDGRQMVPVSTMCFNRHGMMWYAPTSRGQHGGWGWLDPKDTSWTKDDPKPSDDYVCPVMQWTGLYDKNGVEIWEGDVVSRVFINSEEQRIIPLTNQEVKWGPLLGRWEPQATAPDSVSRIDYQVLGNVHEHPHLLKS